MWNSGTVKRTNPEVSFLVSFFIFIYEEVSRGQLVVSQNILGNQEKQKPGNQIR